MEDMLWRGISVSLVIVLVIFGFYTLSISQNDYSDENYLLASLMKADIDMKETSLASQKGISFYDEASFYYEDENYKQVESSCRLARDYFSEESQDYKKIKAELKAKEFDDKLVDIYVEVLDLNSEIALNLYEACEHFESASRYYDKYFYTDVPYDDTSFDMGTAEIDMMNEKIRDHDANVRKYNDKLEEYGIELQSRIEAILNRK